MATVTEPARSPRYMAHGEERILLRGIDWNLYETIVENPANRFVRMTYDRGELELARPSAKHEHDKHTIGTFIVDLAVELESVADIWTYGSATWKREALRIGVEADECYYFDAVKIASFAGRHPERQDDPLPDLMVDVELTRPLLNKMAAYAAMGIPEVWRYDGKNLRIEHLGDDATYHPATISRFVPITITEVQHWIAQAETMSFTKWALQSRAWIREELGQRARLN